jgi:catechol 2,3-dioxygenase-like lactoylglutathione lyase family enzyme
LSHGGHCAAVRFVQQVQRPVGTREERIQSLKLRPDEDPEKGALMATRKPRRPKQAAPVRSRAKKKSAAGKRSASTRAASTTRERRKQAPETLRLRGIEPSITVSDIDRSLRFYTDVLGFFVGQRWTDDGGKLLGVMLKAGVCQLGLSQDDWAKGRERKRGEGVRIWCKTGQNVDTLAKRIKSAGWTLTEEPTQQAWGARTMSLDDPDGFHLSFYSEP